MSKREPDVLLRNVQTIDSNCYSPNFLTAQFIKMDDTESAQEELPPTTEQKGRVFKDEVVVMDFNQFLECRFENCDLVFHGEGSVGIEKCEFEDCDWQFAGSAARTLNFMHLMHEHGGALEEIASELIKQVRGGDDQ